LIEIQPNPPFILDSIPRKQLKLFTDTPIITRVYIDHWLTH